jgi:D-3-phosphoglycerate dehydrogenase
MTHVLISDNVHQRAIDLIEQAPEVTFYANGKLSREETLKRVPEAHGLIVRSGTTVDREMFDAATNLKVIARAGVGVDNIDLHAATEKGVIVMNTPDGNTISTAEHTFGLMLALARHTVPAHNSLLEGRWDRKKYMGLELRNKTLGIIGFGRIGQAIAVRANAFGMNVIAFDVVDMARKAAQLNVKLVDLGTIYREADFITLHPALTDDTRGMINKQTLEAMKPGVRIVNAARGGLIVNEDLAEALDSGQVAGIAMDVYDPEPPSPDNPLIGHVHVIHTPHLAASTGDAQIAVAVDAANQTLDALLLHEYRNVVNPDVLEADSP